MSHRNIPDSGRWYRPAVALLLFLLATTTTFAQDKANPTPAKATPSAAPVDPGLVGVWGVDTQGGYDFRADGTFIMQGAVTYRFDASKGVWHYWQPGTPSVKIAAEYKLSADGKSLSINLKTGKPFTNLKKIR
ncbi:MAG TPA: hypothetical protein VK569_08590 [Bacteroidota bacterium]|nr:hypothetical protein [Bacteroidota bacterium]